MSSANNARLVRAGLRLRGGLWPEATASHLEGIGPMGALEGDPQGPGWCGHGWSEWIAVSEAGRCLGPGALGLYRIRAAGESGLLYVGQGDVRGRLAAHLRKVSDPGHAQGRIFVAGRLECSWVLNGAWHRHQRQELETDLIAAHVLTMSKAPAAQFLG